MKTILTTYDVKEILKGIFYSEENDEEVYLVSNGETEKKSIADYLNIDFYSWKNRVVDIESHIGIQHERFEDWTNSLNNTFNKGYALVEIIDSNIMASEDIDQATIQGRISYIIQTDKIANLEYYLAKIRSKYAGNVQDIIARDGEVLKAFYNIGILLSENEPEMLPNGECIIAYSNFAITYLTSTLSYSDIQIKLSFDGESYYEVPFTKGTLQNVFISQGVPKQNFPQIIGTINTGVSNVRSFSFFDFNKEFMKELNKKFFSLGAVRVNNISNTEKSVNIPIYTKITVGEDVYEYEDIIIDMTKTLVNNDFNVCTMTTKSRGVSNGISTGNATN